LPAPDVSRLPTDAPMTLRPPCVLQVLSLLVRDRPPRSPLRRLETPLLRTTRQRLWTSQLSTRGQVDIAEQGQVGFGGLQGEEEDDHHHEEMIRPLSPFLLVPLARPLFFSRFAASVSSAGPNLCSPRYQSVPRVPYFCCLDYPGIYSSTYTIGSHVLTPHSGTSNVRQSSTISRADERNQQFVSSRLSKLLFSHDERRDKVRPAPVHPQESNSTNPPSRVPHAGLTASSSSSTMDPPLPSASQQRGSSGP
jgi:hypothetical protein